MGYIIGTHILLTTMLVCGVILHKMSVELESKPKVRTVVERMIDFIG